MGLEVVLRLRQYSCEIRLFVFLSVTTQGFIFNVGDSFPLVKVRILVTHNEHVFKLFLKHQEKTNVSL